MPYSEHLCHSLSFVPSFTKEDSIRVQLSYHHSRGPTYEAVVGWVERLNISGFEACVEVPLTKKLNNFKAVQAGTTNLSDFSKNSSGNLKFISWSLCQHWCYHRNRVLASTVFSLKNRLYFYFNRWNYYITLYLALFYQSYCNMSFIWPNDRCWLKFSTILISLSEFHTLMIFFLGGGGGGAS